MASEHGIEMALSKIVKITSGVLRLRRWTGKAEKLMTMIKRVGGDRLAVHVARATGWRACVKPCSYKVRAATSSVDSSFEAIRESIKSNIEDVPLKAWPAESLRKDEAHMHSNDDG